jgi:Na+/H+-dicarboxylate symporter
MLRKMPLVLIFVIIAVMLFEPLVSMQVKSICYAISLSIESVIVFLLPLIIFGLLFRAAASLARQSMSIIILIVVGVCTSNYLSTFLSHFVGSWIYHFDVTLSIPKGFQELKPYWSFTLPKLIANNKAMFAGLFLGILTAVINQDLASKFACQIEKTVGNILYFFAYLIPLFVAGFVIKMKYDGIIVTIAENYAIVFLVIALSQFTYILFLYFITNCFRIKKTIQTIKNMLPAAITGFCTMSSATAMPLTIIGVEKNSNNPELAQSVVPATVNIHLIGDCFAIPIFAYAILKNFGIEEPGLLNYMIFAGYFVLAKFSIAAIPGGGVVVMLPILEAYLNFNSEMLSLITALYVLFDPVITVANVLGNGGFAMIVENLSKGFYKSNLKFWTKNTY